MNQPNIDHSPSYWNSRHYRFYRDSRDAFGVRWQVERPNRDWLWMIPALAVSILAVVVMFARVGS